MDIMTLPRVGPYVGVSHDVTFRKNAGRGKYRQFRVLVYGAYDALGLIGSECNGLVVLDDEKEVIADEILRQGSGYFGPSAEQVEALRQIKGMTWKCFREFVNASRRLRHRI